MTVRIGIDVGGTFTHAVAMDAKTLEVRAHVRVPTTHQAKEGVASGVIQALYELLQQASLAPHEVTFIAHSTTQATNALLEGDLACVGILSLGTGLEGNRTQTETLFPHFEVVPGKLLPTCHAHLDTAKAFTQTNLQEALRKLKISGAQVIVASEAFSVDRPEKEEKVVAAASAEGLPATATHHISSLYGLRIRTRTAALNASILPRMLETANHTEEAVQKTKLSLPLMIMRSDGGVMKIEEMRKRPIQTLLSGPAAGVAAALLYAKVPNSIFVEVGGTSTDLSLIRDGQSLIRSAQIGKHQLYLRTLDVQTLGIAGGSMVRVKPGSELEVGPRSAHIAGLTYSAFAPETTEFTTITFLAPKPGDPRDYVAVQTKTGEPIAITPTCAINALGLLTTGDPAEGSQSLARRALETLAYTLKKPWDTVAQEILTRSANKIAKQVATWLKQARLEKENFILVGGGGAASVLVPRAAELLGLPHQIVPHAAVISAIGCALALLHETVERNLINPSPTDLLTIREEVWQKIAAQGASPESIEVHIEVDRQQNRVRAEAQGALGLDHAFQPQHLSQQEKEKLLAPLLKQAIPQPWEKAGETTAYEIYQATWERARKFFFLSLNKETGESFAIMEKSGLIRLVRHRGKLFSTHAEKLLPNLGEWAQKFAHYGDAGQSLPHIHLITQTKLLNLSGVATLEQLLAMAQAESSTLSPNETIYLLFS